MCSEQEQLFLGPIFKQLAGLGNRWHSECYPALARLFLAISAKTPLCGLVHQAADMKKVLLGLADGQPARSDPAVLAQLHNNLPCLSELLDSDLCQGSVAFPEWLRPLLRAMGALVFKFAEGDGTTLPFQPAGAV